MPPVLASLFDSLDGVGYFFVSSGSFILITASIFFGFGFWLGFLTWGKFKRRFRVGQETIEELKNELAQLKRRAAEAVARPALPQSSPFARAAARPSLAALAQPETAPPPTRPSAAFTLWTEPSRSPPRCRSAPLPPSAAFTLWTLPDPTDPGRRPRTKKPTRQQTQATAIWSEPAGKAAPAPATARASAARRRMVYAADVFESDLRAGRARNDLLLGVVFEHPPADGDDLSLLDGITTAQRESLESLGVHFLKQVACWDRDQAGEFARRLALPDPARASRWTAQASRLLELQERGGAAA